MAKFIVKGRVKYNGVLYNSGEVVEVKKEDVTEFKKHGWEVVKGNEPAGEGKDGEGKGKDGEVKLTVESKKDDIIAELTKRGIEHDPSKTKAELITLLG